MDWNDKNFDDGTEDLISYGVFLGEGGGGTGKPPKNKKSIVIKVVIVAVIIRYKLNYYNKKRQSYDCL